MVNQFLNLNFNDVNIQVRPNKDHEWIVISFIEKYFLCYFKRFIENCFVTKVLFFLYARFEILTPISLMFIEAFKSRSCKCPQTSQL